MKIKLTLDIDGIIAIDRLLESSYRVMIANKTIDQRVIISICIELSDKFSTKARKAERDHNLLTANKKRSVTLKYHEAWALELVIRRALELSEFEYLNYRSNQLRIIADDINQKLV